MTDLTEQWKKGELPCADENHTWLAYYLKQASGRIHADSYWRGNWGHADRNSIIKVLAPVPTYEEYKDLKSKLQLKETAYDFDTARLEEENAKLKELLKECELWFTGVVGNMNDKNVGEHNRNLPIGNFEHIFKVFSQKINQALGEDK